MNIKKSLLLLLFIVLAVSNANAGMFDGIDSVNQQTFNTIHQGSGLALKLAIAFIPVLLFIIAPIGTWIFYNKKTEQEKEDKMKVYLYTAVSSIAGYVAGLVLIYVIGMGIFPKHGGGDKSLEVQSEFWASGVAQKQYGEATNVNNSNQLLQ